MRRFVFADEAGDFNFSRDPSASRYFIVCAIAMESCDLGLDLLKLRRTLLWDGVEIPDYFHATKDSQFVRDRVFQALNEREFKVYAQVLEKSKAQPQVRSSHERFYQYAWHYLFQHSIKRIAQGHDDQLMVTAASVGTKRTRVGFHSALKDVVQQHLTIDAGSWRTSFVPAGTDPCLQAADYCTWAIQRKWERGDSRSYELIAHKIEYEFDTWKRGSKHYY